jgi:hypothetical protein
LNGRHKDKGKNSKSFDTKLGVQSRQLLPGEMRGLATIAVFLQERVASAPTRTILSARFTSTLVVIVVVGSAL